MMRKIGLLILATLLVGVCVGESNPMTAQNMSSGEKNIVDTAIAAGNLKTFVTALQTAGLVDALKKHGNFTIFAPTDAAFAKIPKDKLNALMANTTELTILLGYHAVPGKVMSTELKNGMKVRTVQRGNLTISLSNGAIMVNNAKVIQADIICTTGVIHEIDTVLIPKLVAKTSNLNLSKSKVSDSERSAKN